MSEGLDIQLSKERQEGLKRDSAWIRNATKAGMVAQAPWWAEAHPTQECLDLQMRLEAAETLNAQQAAMIRDLQAQVIEGGSVVSGLQDAVGTKEETEVQWVRGKVTSEPKVAEIVDLITTGKTAKDLTNSKTAIMPDRMTLEEVPAAEMEPDGPEDAEPDQEILLGDYSPEIQEGLRIQQEAQRAACRPLSKRGYDRRTKEFRAWLAWERAHSDAYRTCPALIRASRYLPHQVAPAHQISPHEISEPAMTVEPEREVVQVPESRILGGPSVRETTTGEDSCGYTLQVIGSDCRIHPKETTEEDAISTCIVEACVQYPITAPFQSVGLRTRDTVDTEITSLEPKPKPQEASWESELEYPISRYIRSVLEPVYALAKAEGRGHDVRVARKALEIAQDIENTHWMIVSNPDHASLDDWLAVRDYCVERGIDPTLPPRPVEPEEGPGHWEPDEPWMRLDEDGEVSCE